MSNAEKRIPVTEERWKELHDLKEAGQTSDELLEEIVEAYEKARLFRDVNRIRNEEDSESLSEVLRRMGDEYESLVAQNVKEFFGGSDEKSERILREDLEKLPEPYPGRRKGDTEKITWSGEVVYRVHIGRIWTAFYDTIENEHPVQVLEILPSNEVNDQYGDLD